MYPQFEIHSIEVIDGKKILFGSVDRTAQGTEEWIGDGWCGMLLREYITAFGRWKKKGTAWQFRIDDDEKEKLTLKEGERISVIDAYWGERAEIVLDKSIDWVRTEFEIKGEVHHEHCRICWETSTVHKDSTYYLGNGIIPVCVKCYEMHVSARDISFIPVHI